MLTHIMLLELGDTSTIEEVIRRAQPLADVETVLRLKVGRDVNATPRSRDVALVAQFSTLEDLAAFEQAPAHLEWCEFVRAEGGETATVTFAEHWAASLHPVSGDTSGGDAIEPATTPAPG